MVLAARLGRIFETANQVPFSVSFSRPKRRELLKLLDPYFACTITYRQTDEQREQPEKVILAGIKRSMKCKVYLMQRERERERERETKIIIQCQIKETKNEM